MIDLTRISQGLRAIQHAIEVRSGGNPNHDAKGRFAPGSGKSDAEQSAETPPRYGGGVQLHYTPHIPANWQEVVHQATNPDGPTAICTVCSRMNNGPLAGQRLGFVPGNDTPMGTDAHWNHGLCAECSYRQMVEALGPILSRKGYSDDEIAAITEAFVQSGMSTLHEWLNAHPLSPPASSQPDTDTQRLQLQAFAARVRAIAHRADLLLLSVTE